MLRSPAEVPTRGSAGSPTWSDVAVRIENRVGVEIGAAGSALFLVVSGIAVAAWALVAPKDLRFTGALVIELRDFAAAAALAAQAFGAPAATVPAVYGVLMLLLGAAAAQLLNSRRSSAAASPPAAD